MGTQCSKFKCFVAAALWCGIMAFQGLAAASTERSTSENSKAFKESAKSPGVSSWAFAFDNDVLVPGSRDQDYTYGFNLTLAGKQAEKQPASLHQPLDWINSRVGFDDLMNSGIEASKIEYGLFGFTPEDISQPQALSDDRPYSSLVYVSSTREYYRPGHEISWQSTLTVGVLGLDLVGYIQEGVHSAYDGSKPRGWDNQISNGGELTARYGVSRQSLVLKRDSGLELKTTMQASLGYITEVGWSLSARSGIINTPWVSFNPELTSYGEKSVPNARVKVSERYLWGGIAFKLRAYNAFLEGQFRDSDITYTGDEINRGIIEAWLGYTFALSNGYSFTYTIRGHTSELKRGSGDRNVLWGGVLISKIIR